MVVSLACMRGGRLGLGHLDLEGVLAHRLAVHLQPVADGQAAAFRAQVGLGPVGVHPQHQAAIGGLVDRQVLLSLLKDHLRVEDPLPPEGDPVVGHPEGGQGALQARQLALGILQGDLPLLLAQDPLGHQLHHVFLSGLDGLHAPDGNDHWLFHAFLLPMFLLSSQMYCIIAYSTQNVKSPPGPSAGSGGQAMVSAARLSGPAHQEIFIRENRIRRVFPPSSFDNLSGAHYNRGRMGGFPLLV